MPEHPGWENADTCARLRTRVAELSRTKWAEAHGVAAEIPIPWYRVQAFSLLVPHAPEDRVDDLLTKAQREAAKGPDEYQRIAVLTWVIGAALARGRTAAARQILTFALAQAPAITPLRSRAAALDLLLGQAVRIAAPEARAAASALIDVAEMFCNSPKKGGRRWGKYYVNNIAYHLHDQHLHLGLQLLTARFGEQRAVAAFARRGSAQPG